MRLTWCLPLLLTWFPVPGYAAVDWGALLNQSGGSRVHFGVAIGGSQPYQRNFDDALAPASTSKLFTAGIALAMLGEDFRYPTVMHWKRLDGTTAAALELVGSGDPSWGMSEFGESLTTRVNAMAAALKAQGIRVVLGNPAVSSVDPRWDVTNFPIGWKAADTTSCGGALAQSFNLDINCAVFKVTSPTSGSWQSAGLSFPVRLDVRSGKATSLSARLAPRSAGGYEFVIEGQWKSGSGPKSFTLPIYDTRPWIAALFRQAVLNQGIQIKEPMGWSEGEAKSLTFYSLPLSVLLKPFLKNSVNFMGDAFLKTLAAKNDADRADDLLAPGLDILQDYLIAKGLPRDFKIYDGSGLSRLSRISPRLLFEFLEQMKREKFFPAFWNALAIAGVDGTLSSRMKGTSAAGVLRGKTGTLDGVYNLAGYVPRGKDFASFVVISRTTTSESSTARAAADRVGVRLASLHADPLFVPDFTPFPYVPEHAGMDAQ